MGNVSYNKTN